MNQSASKVIVAAVLIGLCASLQPAMAEGQTIEDAASMLPESVIRYIQKNPDRFREQTVLRLFTLAPDGVATPERVRTAEKVRFAERRAQQLQRFLIYDLDGDGLITAEELDSALSVSNAKQRAEAMLFRVEADADDNGVVTFVEAVDHVERRLALTSQQPKGAFDIMIFDLNGDERVDVAEVSAAIEEIAKLIENDPTVAGGKAVTAKSSSCSFPKPADGARVVVLSEYEGDALSTVAVSGQDGETSVATVTIEPGTEPLWIFATALKSMIWNINGSTKRVERFVVQPQGARSGPGAGVVGLKKEQVSFVSSGACTGYFSDADDGKTRIELAKLASWLARPVDHLIVHYTLAGMGLPSGRLTNHGGRRDGNLVIAADGRSFVISRDGVRPLEGDTEGEVKQVQGIALVAAALRRYNPGGVVDIALKDVVAAGEVERYEVLPQQAGLLQLMRSGELRRMNDGYFLIQAPIPRFPAGLAGGHSVKFILGDGVPMPAGSPGHSPVYSETTGECLTGTRCRR